MAPRVLDNLRSGYLLGESVVVTTIPETISGLVARDAFGVMYPATLESGSATLARLPEGTFALEARDASGEIVDEEFFGVRRYRGEDPVLGFATSFDDASRDGVVAWLRDLRCTVVQVYDWMDSYSHALSTDDHYNDPLGRPLSRSSLEALIASIKEVGAVAQAYAPIIAAGQELASQHDDWRLYRNDNAPETLGDLLEIMDPGNAEWQSYWIDNYGRATAELGFDGLHLDTYGYPRDAKNVSGDVDMERSYASFVSAVRAAFPAIVISFNQVNGVPRGFEPPEPPSFRYVEVWPPNHLWRHLEGLLARSTGGGQRHGDTLAIYPPVWRDDRAIALRTCVLSEAVVTMLGANALIWGDRDGVLSHPYYVDHQTLDDTERNRVLEWHRFALRTRDLFRVALDTSWYELSDENASVTVSWSGGVSPEPLGGSLFVRVIRSDDLVVVSLLDLTGSEQGSWHAGTVEGLCQDADVDILLGSPESWNIDVAVLGRDGGRFTASEYETVSMREGRGAHVSVTVNHGWAILRLTRKVVS